MADSSGINVPLNTEHAGRKIWLVKVPHFVANKWKEICDKSMNEDHSEIGPKLGTIRRTANADDSTHPFDLILDNAQTVELPQEYSMNVSTHASQAMMAFQGSAGRMNAEGVVQYRFDVEPAHRAPAGAGGGAVEIDPAYRKLSRERQRAAEARTRTVQRMVDPLITNIRRPVGAREVGQKRKAGPAEKRTALPPEELQAALFLLFERQQRWAFPQLQRETEQPTMHLKGVLQEVAMQNKRGPYKDLWELKKEFRTGAEPAEAPPPGPA